VKIPRPCSSSPLLLYNWQYTPSRLISSPKMMRNSSHISGRQSSTTKRPRFSQPGTLTLAEILGAPSRPLWWLLPLTPNTLRPLLQALSSSPRNARSNLPSQQATPPSVETVGDTGPLPICALHHTCAAHRCQNPTCLWSWNHKPVPSCCPTSPPHCCNSGNDHTATFKECRARPRPTVPSRPPSP